MKQKEREEKAKLKDVNMAAPSFDRKILNDQHQREKDAKAKERAQPGTLSTGILTIAKPKRNIKSIIR